METCNGSSSVDLSWYEGVRGAPERAKSNVPGSYRQDFRAHQKNEDCFIFLWLL